MKLKLGETIDRLALLSKVLVAIFGTKDKTVLNKVRDGLEGVKQVKDAVAKP